jgi:pyridoxamine 5'-phosphate oxidase family protein
MSNFRPKELEYLQNQRLGRLATVNEVDHPQIAPVGFRYNPELDTIDIGGRAMSQTKKFRNILKNNQVAFVVDDVLPPWKPRGVEIRGTAEAVYHGGKDIFGDRGGKDYWDDVFVRITPTQIIGWGLEGDGYQPQNRKVGSS